MDASEVLRIAQLAHLHLEPQEIIEIQKKFAAILAHFAQLKEIDTSDVEPLFHFLEQMPLRADEAEAPLLRHELLQNAPDQLEGCFCLSKVVGGAE